jgi:branched-chain amino acid transport system ATP-binding protein
VRNLSLSVERGTIVSVIGPKRRRARPPCWPALMGLLPAKGEVAYLGLRAGALTVEERVARGLILVPERRELFAAMSVADNLELGGFQRALSGERGWRVTLDEIYERFPRLGERRAQLAGTLSGGERQMLAMGRALMGKPKLLMLDEPSLGLAPLMVREIFNIVGACARAASRSCWSSRTRGPRCRFPITAYVLETGDLRSRAEAELRRTAVAATSGSAWRSPGADACPGHRLIPERALQCGSSKGIPLTDLSVPPVNSILLAEARHLLLEPCGARRQRALRRPRVDPHARLSDFADLYFQYSRMESWSPRRRHRQSGLVQHRRGRGHPCRARREAGFRIFRRHLARGTRRSRRRPRGPLVGRASPRSAALSPSRRRPFPLRTRRSGRLAAGRGQGRAAGAPRAHGEETRLARRAR